MTQRSFDELLRQPELPPSPGAKVHNFHSSLAKSEEGSLEPFWDQVYRKHFPTMVACVPLRGDTAAQRQGKDRAGFVLLEFAGRLGDDFIEERLRLVPNLYRTGENSETSETGETHRDR